MRTRELVALAAIAGLLCFGVIKAYRWGEAQHAATLFEQAPRTDGLTWRQHVVGEVRLEVFRQCGSDRGCWAERLPTAIEARVPKGTTVEARKQIESDVLIEAGMDRSKT
jgi:hypothetical protein